MIVSQIFCYIDKNNKTFNNKEKPINHLKKLPIGNLSHREDKYNNNSFKRGSNIILCKEEPRKQNKQKKNKNKKQNPFFISKNK